jgi:FkbM family methyltransferase
LKLLGRIGGCGDVASVEMITSRLKHYAKLIVRDGYHADYVENRRLRSLSRYEATTTRFQGNLIHIVDALTYLVGVDEIFNKRVYEFRAKTSEPIIIDCGANIGLSVLYFKQLYPRGRIIAFEADPTVHEALRKNMQSFGVTGVTVVNKAVWNSETRLKFLCEGADSGRIARHTDEGRLVEVETVRLKPYLQQKIDFLKIDIEGAETEVLKDCRDDLWRVDLLFVEYHSHVSEKQNLHELLATLQQAGFRYHIKGVPLAPFPFLEHPVNMGMDLQLNIFAYRS